MARPLLNAYIFWVHKVMLHRKVLSWPVCCVQTNTSIFRGCALFTDTVIIYEAPAHLVNDDFGDKWWCDSMYYCTSFMRRWVKVRPSSVSIMMMSIIFVQPLSRTKHIAFGVMWWQLQLVHTDIQKWPHEHILCGAHLTPSKHVNLDLRQSMKFMHGRAQKWSYKYTRISS